MKILICGLPGSGKTTLAKPFADLISRVHINADKIREHYNDWDFTLEGRMRQAQRMRYLSDGVVMTGKVAIADFVCPTEAARKEFDEDFTVWMDTISRSRYEDTNNMFDPPEHCDYHVAEWFNDTHAQLTEVVASWRERNAI